MQNIYVNLNDNTSDVSWRLRLSSIGRISLDEILDDLIIAEDLDSDEIRRQQELLDKIDCIVQTYLTQREQLIYYCVIHMQKRVSEVMKIVGYNDWRTTSNNIERVFRLIRLYYDYEMLNHRKLNKIINKHFTVFEKEIIGLLENRYTIHEIKNEIGYHYAKSYKMVNDILNTMIKLKEPCKSYYYFLIEIRKFKKLNDYKIVNNHIKK